MNEPVRIRVLSIDDHPPLREGIATLINNQPDMSVVGEACSGHEAIEQFRELRPDVTLMNGKAGSQRPHAGRFHRPEKGNYSPVQKLQLPPPASGATMKISCAYSGPTVGATPYRPVIFSPAFRIASSFHLDLRRGGIDLSQVFGRQLDRHRCDVLFPASQ